LEDVFLQEIWPFNPRSPEKIMTLRSQSRDAQDERAKGKTMRLLSIRSLFFALAVLGLLAATFGVAPPARAQIAISVSFGPPELPVYEQPICPGEGYLWVPGYWAYADDDYYWVPGTWVIAPEVGYLWTPGYWGWRDNGYYFNDGYWGPHVGFYGGISYGFGYYGHGYEGGRWDNGRFFYNRAVNNVNVTIIHNVYETRVNETNVTHVSYNGGNGGVNERPRPEEQNAQRERHIAPVAAQTQHIEAARSNPELRASTNRGKPPIAATPKPAAFHDSQVVPAKAAGAPYTPPARTGNANAANSANNPNRPNAPNNPNRPDTASNNAGRSDSANSNRPNNVFHPKDVPPIRPTPPQTGNPKLDQKYQQQQQQLVNKQDQERQRLQQRQDQDHQRLAQQKANDARQQQVEQQHQRQTEQLVQKHTQQVQNIQQRQQPPPQRQQQQPPQKPGKPN
jgi:hypothetical protein